MAIDDKKRMTLNLRDISTSMEPIPEGKYLVEVVSAEIKEGKESEKPYLNMQLKVNEEEYNNRRLWFTGSLDVENQTALGITIGNLENLLGEELAGQENFELDCDRMVTLQCYAVVRVEEASDEYPERNNVSRLAPLDEEALELQRAAMASSEELWG